jgi:sugar/nucleoside kinase (ribokinase family)
MGKILGIGNALVDILVSADDSFLKANGLAKGSMQLVDRVRVEELRSKLNPQSVRYASGGSSANTIYGIAQLGNPAGYIGKVGLDSLGKFFENDLKLNHIDPHLFYSNTTDTGTALTFITPDSERTFATYLGASIELSENDFSAEMFTPYSLLHLEGYLVSNPSLLKKIIQLARGCGLEVSIDLASYNVVEDNKDFLIDILKNDVDIAFSNEAEAKALTGKEPYEALQEISGYCRIAIVKVGSKGSLIRANNNQYEIEAYKVKSVDTTGAGDLYASGFLYGYINKMSLPSCGKLGSLVASRVVEEIGAKIPSPKWDEINLLKASMI